MDLSIYLPVSWPLYHSYAQKLAATILADKKPLDEIIGISRGGLTFGQVLSDLLNLPISTIGIQSYQEILSQGELKVTHALSKSIRGSRVLLVDDIADSGKTLVRAKDYLLDLNPQSITTVTMFYKPKSVVVPDYYARKTDKWVIFPTEIVETAKYIIGNLQKEGKTKAQIQEFLTNLELNKNQISFVYKYHIKPG